MTIRINGEEIPQAAIDYELNRLVKFYYQHMSADAVRNQMDVLRKRAKEQAIGAKLLMAEAGSLDIRVSDEEVDSKIGEMVKNAGGETAFQELLNKQNLAPQEFRRTIIEGRRVDILIERVTADAPEPEETDMRKHFEAHADEYRRPEQTQARHILIKPHADCEADRETAKSRLLEIRGRIQDGSDFSDEASMHSDCPSGKKSGGSLGWISRGTMVPAIDQALFTLKAGQLSEIVETPLGYHLIEKIAQEDSVEADYEDVADGIRDFLRHAYRGETVAAYVKELKQKAVVEER